jgi:hypothetical protein
MLKSRIAELQEFLKAGTNNRVVRDLVELGVSGLQMTTAIAIADGLSLKETRDFVRANRSDFVGLFAGKETLAKEAFALAINKLSAIR